MALKTLDTTKVNLLKIIADFKEDNSQEMEDSPKLASFIDELETMANNVQFPAKPDKLENGEGTKRKREESEWEEDETGTNIMFGNKL